jgi:AcrR family transcriptional regulator
MTSLAPRPARLPGQERREHFLDAAAQLILERGIDSVTMEGVAAAAGVSKGLGYAYFTNRGDLLLALLDREVSALDRRVQDAIDASDGFEEKIRAAVHAWFAVISERGRILGPLLQAGSIQEPLQKRRDRRTRRLEELWGRLAETHLGLPHREAVAASAILLAGMAGMLDRWTKARDPRRLLEDTYVRLAVGGLREVARHRD